MDITTTQILGGLGWAVIHSLWQGLLAAMAVFIFRALTRDSQAALRCGFEIIALFTCFAAFLVTFALQVSAPITGAGSIPTLSEIIASPVAAVTSGSVDLAGMAISPASAAQYAPLFGILWYIGFILMASRYAFGLAMTHKLRTTGLSPVPQNWNERFQLLVLNAGIVRHVTLHISNRVKGSDDAGIFQACCIGPGQLFLGPARQSDRSHIAA